MTVNVPLTTFKGPLEPLNLVVSEPTIPTLNSMPEPATLSFYSLNAPDAYADSSAVSNASFSQELAKSSPSWFKQKLSSGAKTLKKYAPFLAGVGAYFTFHGDYGPWVNGALWYAMVGTTLHSFLGKEVRDYGLAYMLTDSLLRSSVFAETPLSENIEGIAKAASYFIAGAVAVRGLDFWNQRKKLGDLTQETLEKMNSGNETFQSRLKSDERFSFAVNALETQLKHEKTLLEFLQYDPETFDLKSELSHLRIGRNNIRMAFAYYMAFTQSLMLPKGRAPMFMSAHEMLHALHHKAVMRAITPEILSGLESLVENDLQPSFVKDRSKVVRDHLQKKNDLNEIPEDVRWAAADLIFYSALRHKKDKVEAIGSYLDLRLGGAGAFFMRLVEKMMYLEALPFSLLAGTYRSNSLLLSHKGYSNPLLMRKIKKEGLIGSLLD